MKVQLEKRLKELQKEYEKGQQQLAKLDNETRGLREMLLRINGGIQVLQEEISKVEEKK